MTIAPNSRARSKVLNLLGPKQKVFAWDDHVGDLNLFWNEITLGGIDDRTATHLHNIGITESANAVGSVYDFKVSAILGLNAASNLYMLIKHAGSNRELH